jgi:uncharacterized protein
MEISDERILLAPRQHIWELLNDPEVLQACIPGCEQLEANDATHMNGVVATKIGPITARFTGEVTLEDLNPPASYAIVGQGKGGVAGHARGRADIALEDHPEGTLLKYAVTIAIGGKIAQLGGRLITTTAKKLSETFFENLAKQVEARSAAMAGNV